MAADAAGILAGGDDDADARDAFLEHVDALLQYPLTAIPLNGPLVQQVRGILTRQPLVGIPLQPDAAQRRRAVAAGMDGRRQCRALPAGGCSSCATASRSTPACPASSPGAATTRSSCRCCRASPRTPPKTPGCSAASRAAALPPRSREMNQLRRDVLALYLDDYTRRWDAMLANVALKPFAQPLVRARRAVHCCRRRICRCATC